MPDKYEAFVNTFLRLNGYFTVPSFIVHAADDARRISNDGKISSHTEVDAIGIRMPHSIEVSGAKTIQNYEPLVNGGEGRFDCLIAEVKTGNNTTPNKVWKPGASGPAISYILRFVGFHVEAELKRIAATLSSNYQYVDGHARYRYVIFAHEPNDHYVKLGVIYITFREAIRFLVGVRGESWMRAGIGNGSLHHQWDQVMRDLFAIANTSALSNDDRIAAIESYLAA